MTIEEKKTTTARKRSLTTDQLFEGLLAELKRLEKKIFSGAGELSLQLREPNAAASDGRFQACVVFSPFGPGESKILYVVKSGDTVKSAVRELLVQVTASPE